MASDPPHSGSTSRDSNGAQRWTGRASVGNPPVVSRPAAPAPPPPPVYPTAKPKPSGGYPRTRPGVRPRWGRIFLVGLAVLALVAGAGLLTSYLWVRHVDDGLKRTDPFAALEGRPQKVVNGTLNILLVGSDSRDPDMPSVEGGPARTDTIVILHIPASHDKAYLVSIPRDTWVYVPESPDGQNGDTMAKINASYAWGGLPLTVETVERFTGVRMDHVALIDFNGFIKVTDALGGVDMNIEQSIVSIHEPYRSFTAGPNHLDGAEALDYVRQRYQFPDGDFARMRHQHEFLKALLDKAVSQGTVTNIGTFKEFVSSVASALTVDKDFSLIDLGWQFRSLRSDNLTFVVSPNLGSDDIDGQSVVVSDKQNASELYDAMARDTLAAWVAQHPSVVEGG
jgi:LCP family protein required for cell wall assembly